MSPTKSRSARSLRSSKHSREESDSAEPASTAPPPPKKTKIEPEEHDVDLFYSLPDEIKGKVPIYDTCDEIRQKIRNHHLLPGMTKAAFLRQLSKCFAPPRNLDLPQLHAFLRFEGSIRGCENRIYYRAHVYFEKLKIKKNEPKTPEAGT
jgi:hypothetical protein